MKKPWIYLAVCFAVSMALCLFVSWPREESSIIVTVPTWPSDLTKPTHSSSTEPTEPEVPGQVRLYFADEQNRQVMEALIQEYQEQTGVEVILLDSRENATIFPVRSSTEAAQWQEQMLDLTGTQVLEKLYSLDFALVMDSVPLGVGMDVTGYGLIYNASLLAQTGFTRTDIGTLAELKTVTDMILTEKQFYSFGCANFDGLEFARLLYGLSVDPAQVRSFVDLYLQHDAASGDATEQFANSKAVFYVGGVWEYDAIAQLGINNLDILPVYTQDGGSFHCICTNYWAVSSKAEQKDMDVSLDFLAWMVTAGEDTPAPVDSLGYLAPFADAAAAPNPFYKLLRKYIATEPVTVRWEIAPGATPFRLQNLASALDAYRAAPTDENWAQVAQYLSQ